MITGCLQKKNGYYYAVLYLKVDGKRKTKWIATKLPVATTSERKAKKALDEIRMQYELQEENKQETSAVSASGRTPEEQMLFVDYMEKWLDSVRPSIATATYQSYSIMMKARVIPYFTASAVRLGALTPQDIEDFYQTILNDGCTTNTVIHYHEIGRAHV